MKLEPEDSHVGASVTGFISATVRAQQKFFYVFRLSNGVLRHSTISQCKALTQAWNILDDEYGAWHVHEASSTPTAFLEQGGGDSSDQSDSVLDSADEDDEADDFQRLSEVELLRKAIQLCKVLEVKLGTNRPPPFWSEVQQLQFLDKKKLPHNLPQLPIVLRQLVGSQILVYKAEVSSGSLLTMTTQKRLACYFASHGAFTGEHFESLNEKPLMQARLKSGLIISVPASQIVGSITALVGKLETQTVSDNAILFGVSANYMKPY